ncbi:protoporphyrinogen oxidase [Ornithinimicrobium sp. F0845]|uniref:protoporphyrinogen oxidase n=1 Tax=Ornithinimicrobium sp. F0845 TaxID=2926412 RepID=UPI001FF19371|nr:protoporphyrinogen oxidase [Ornithinimicrobium sp. F0845]
MRYLVIGGGISGLAAAWELVQHVPGSEVTVLDAADRPGGKLRGETVGGVTVDVGAESVLARRPEAVDLIGEVGLGGRMVHPTGASAAIWSRGGLHPIPRRTVVGVPADPDDLGTLLTPEEVARIRAEVPAPLAARDMALGELVAARLGDAVVDRLVEPLLGGVYAGHAREISAAAAAPALLAAARAGESLVATADRAVPAPAPGSTRPPVFAGIDGGLHQLPSALAERLRERRVTVRGGTIVRELHRAAGAWRMVSGPVPSPEVHEADRLILALPPAPAARLLRDVAPVASAALGTVETASMAVLTYALPADQLPDLPGSGFLVPPRDGRFIKAATFSAVKWDWVRTHGRGAGPDGQDVVLLRASVGRHREEASLQHPDPVLLDRALADLALALGTPLPRPVARHVQRWGGGLPQYAVGHLDLVATVREGVAEHPGLAVAGATYDGVGIPACIASGRGAARQVLAT